MSEHTPYSEPEQIIKSKTKDRMKYFWVGTIALVVGAVGTGITTYNLTQDKEDARAETVQVQEEKETVTDEFLSFLSNVDQVCQTEEADKLEEYGFCQTAEAVTNNPEIITQAGETGPEGPRGDQGPRGFMGVQGPTGPQGIMGLLGEIGDTGTSGAVGSTGSTGAVGATGATGLTGVDGAQGLQGPVGFNGGAGADGTNGTNGINGTDGIDGVDGITPTVTFFDCEGADLVLTIGGQIHIAEGACATIISAP